MSQRAPGKPASAFLDDEGNIDLSAVRSATNAHGNDSTHITSATCGKIRRVMSERKHAGHTSEAVGIGETAVRRHAKGTCHHDADAVDEPTLSYTRGDGWRVDE